jgi:hypothetical protein
LADGARALIKRGADPATLLTARHAGKAHDCFTPASLAWWAGWTIKDPAGGRIQRAAWKPYAGPLAGTAVVSGRAPGAPLEPPAVDGPGDTRAVEESTTEGPLAAEPGMTAPSQVLRVQKSEARGRSKQVGGLVASFKLDAVNFSRRPPARNETGGADTLPAPRTISIEPLKLEVPGSS